MSILCRTWINIDSGGLYSFSPSFASDNASASDAGAANLRVDAINPDFCTKFPWRLHYRVDCEHYLDKGATTSQMCSHFFPFVLWVIDPQLFHQVII